MRLICKRARVRDCEAIGRGIINLAMPLRFYNATYEQLGKALNGRIYFHQLKVMDHRPVEYSDVAIIYPNSAIQFSPPYIYLIGTLPAPIQKYLKDVKAADHEAFNNVRWPS